MARNDSQKMSTDPSFTERIPITDDMMFAYAMRRPKVCAAVIECLIPGIHIAKVHFRDEPDEALPETQHSIQGELGTHSVRLDVYLDDGNSIFNVEMQTVRNHSLPKRARYYGSRIDCEHLQAAVDYEAIRPTYVIFICTFDPFGRGRYRYCFENICTEEPGLKLNDQSYKLFFNTTGTKGDITPELKQLLWYFNSPEGMDAGQSTPLVQTLDQIVEDANQNADWRRERMTWAQKLFDERSEGKKEGIIEGLKEGKKEGLKEGKKEGLKEGKKEGKREGKREGEQIANERWTKLLSLLIAQNRYDDVKSAAEDPEARERLLKEFCLQ